MTYWDGFKDYLGSLFRDGFTDPIDKTLGALPWLGDWLTKNKGRERSLKMFAEVLGSKVALSGFKGLLGWMFKDEAYRNFACWVAGAGTLVASPALKNRYGEEAAVFGTMTIIYAYMHKMYGAQGARQFWQEVKLGAPVEKLKAWFKGYKAQDYVTTPKITPRYTPPSIIEKAGSYIKQMYSGQQEMAGSMGLSGVQRAGNIGYSGGGAGWAARYYAPQQVSVSGTMGPLLNP